MTANKIAERYILQDELGSGGMGTVYRGLDTVTGQSIAIKQLKAMITQPDNIERFKREGEALRHLNHPNIVKMLDAVEEDGNHYLVMEYVSGGDLTRLTEQRPMPVSTILKLAIDLADALTRTHKLNIIHRDLKPANILIGTDGVLRLTDFGVAHVGSKQRMTDTDAIVGTIDYLPPEAFSGSIFDARGDIWAFGVILFELLSGQRPFAGSSIIEVIHAITAQPVPDLEVLCPTTPVALVDLIYRMLEKEPQTRIPSVRIVGAELEAILEDRALTPQSTRFVVETSSFARRTKHNLPAQTTAFVGREHELEALARFLKDPDTRLVTILAPGGMGKTRLSLAAAERAMPDFDAGVYFVELAPLTEADSIASAIARATDYPFQNDGRSLQQQLNDFFSNKTLLLVMDNFEHLLDRASLITELLQAAPSLKILATTRQRLGQPGETLFHLTGMDFPDWETPAAALNYAAIKLFMNSARRVQPEFELTGDNLRFVARICRLVQGMPLGIVLAASWLGVLTPEDIAAEIAQSLDFLATDDGGIPERQRSIRAVMDYSWQQLRADEQQVFMKLSVFRGGFTREAAEAVADANLRTLLSLTTQSLIRRTAESGRYEVHELLRQFAEEQLVQANLRESGRAAHQHYFMNFLTSRDADIRGKRQIPALNEIQADYENIHMAWLNAIRVEDGSALITMLNTISVFSFIRWRITDWIEWLNKALVITQDKKLQIYLRVKKLQAEVITDVLPEDIESRLAELTATVERFDNDPFMVPILAFVKGRMLEEQRQPELALPYYWEAVRLYRELGDTYFIPAILFQIAFASGSIGRTADFLKFLRQSVETAQQTGNLAELVWPLNVLVMDTVFSEGRIEAGIKDLRHTIQLCKDIGTTRAFGLILGNLSTLLVLAGEFSEAFAIAEQARQIGLDLNDTDMVGSSLRIQAVVVGLADEDYASVKRLAEEALELILPINRGRRIIAYFALAIAGCGLGDVQLVISSLLVFLRFKGMAIGTWHRITVGLSAFIAFERQQPNQAVERLACAYTGDASVMVWMDKWRWMTNLKATLQKQLGNGAYDSAWERGKLLDLNSVVQQLLDEFAGDIP